LYGFSDYIKKKKSTIFNLWPKAGNTGTDVERALNIKCRRWHRRNNSTPKSQP